MSFGKQMPAGIHSWVIFISSWHCFVLLLSWHFCYHITRDPSTSLILFSQATPHDFGQSLGFRTANSWDFLRSHRNVWSPSFPQKKLPSLSKTLAAATTKKWDTIYMETKVITHPQNHLIGWGSCSEHGLTYIYAGHRGIYNPPTCWFFLQKHCYSHVIRDLYWGTSTWTKSPHQDRYLSNKVLLGIQYT